MKFNRWFSLWAGTALLGVVSAGAILRADDKPAKEDDKKTTETKEVKKSEVRVIAVPGRHWIGVHATPITDEALKSQLNLKEDRLIVVQVVPESPSAKAGLQQHDILIKFDDKDLVQMDDLVKHIKGSGEKEFKLQVMRSGKIVTIPITPAERPADMRVTALREVLPQDLRVWVEEGEKGDGEGKKLTFRMLGPGIATAKAFAHGHGAEFPNGLSLSVSRENDQPAKIVAKKDGKTYETTADKLNELPEDIRGHVQRLLHAPQVMALSLSDLNKLHGVDAAKIHADVQKAVESATKQADEARARHEAVRSRIEVRRAEGSNSVDELRKEIEALRKDLQKIKEDKKDD